MPTFQHGSNTNTATRAWVERTSSNTNLNPDPRWDTNTEPNTHVETDTHTERITYAEAGAYGEATALVERGVYTDTDNDSAIDMDGDTNMDSVPKGPQEYRSIFNRTAIECDISTADVEEDQLEDTPRLRIFYYLSDRRLSEKRLCYNSPFFQYQLRVLRRQQVDCAICKEPLHALPDRLLDVPSKKFHWQVACVSCGHLFHWICISTWRSTPMSKSAGDRCPHCRQSWLPLFSSLFPSLEPYAVDFYLECMLKGWPSLIISPAQSMMGLPDSYAVGLHFQNIPFCIKVLKSILEAVNATHNLIRFGELTMMQNIVNTRGYSGLKNLLGEIQSHSSRHQSDMKSTQSKMETGIYADSQIHWQPPAIDMYLEFGDLDDEMIAAVQRDLDATQGGGRGSTGIEQEFESFSVYLTTRRLVFDLRLVVCRDGLRFEDLQGSKQVKEGILPLQSRILA